MRAFSRKALKKIELHSVGYEISSEIIGEVKRVGLKLSEIQITTIYSDYSNMKGQNWINGINVFTKMIMLRLAGKK
jgi:hypothetical protein